ncbi:MAG: hypothetical protein ACRYHA_16565 [Janthinobacterium lividum]
MKKFRNEITGYFKGRTAARRNACFPRLANHLPRSIGHRTRRAFGKVRVAPVRVGTMRDRNRRNCRNCRSRRNCRSVTDIAPEPV